MPGVEHSNLKMASLVGNTEKPDCHAAITVSEETFSIN